ncbi:MAG: TIGR03943 family protein [Cyanobacteriota bacterium]|nr:TIGR03943 family protein [Cyanobacteriota bacterium]
MSNTSVRVKKKSRSLSDWIEILAIITWGILLFKYWFTNKLIFLINPNYFWLSNFTAILLLSIGVYKIWQMLSIKSKKQAQQMQHMSTFPPGIASRILLLTAISGLIFSPQALTSDYVTNYELSTFSTISRSKVQEFRPSSRPEERSLVDWVKTLTVYPEPDSYLGQKAKVKGFVVHLETLPDDYIMITRFVITHCVLDASPMGLPVKLTQSREVYPPDTWLEIEGEMTTAVLERKRASAIQAISIKEIPEPKNPYEY